MHEAELLFTRVLNCSRPDLYLNKSLRLSKDKGAVISDALKRRVAGEPLQYILGVADFYGMQFKVSPDCLIPRPETEILVEAALRYPADEILELGTGSGCVAIAIAKSLKGAEITATDISDKALAVARENSVLHETVINFIQADLFNNKKIKPGAYGLIISNPPYIATVDLSSLQPEISHEPRLALDGGNDGLDFYRRISEDSVGFLKDGGHLIMEVGFGQDKEVANLLKKTKRFEIIEVVKDYNHIDRVIVARKSWIS